MKEKLIEQLQPIAEKYFSQGGRDKVEVRIGDRKLIIHIELSIYNLISTNTLELFKRDTAELVRYFTTFSPIEIGVSNKERMTIVYEIYNLDS
ncbi:hypothetical protein [Chryseobacterium oncorhynchi]|uniref:Na+-translocating membrane potential-generating system MpsC domain-containing protein n=1 Tax=Chryseobacterium oncorhynchi TaxID=741074 RepID=A0A316WCT8_9FLAO|nr:hypothetical protein [Chryseobacterium oncorhynchi]PWN59224.1 hypothetical protein C1638_021695 [Chryseobacterium oncorhynchi]